MRLKILAPVAVTLLLVWSAPAAAQLHAHTGPIAGYDPANETFVDVKSPELEDSWWFGTTWALHQQWAYASYAGFLFDLHYDGNETSFLNIIPRGMHTRIEVPGIMGLHTSWEFPGSQTSSQVVSPVAVWIPSPLAMNSGVQLPVSTPIPLFQVTGHAKNTTCAFNSDIDITITAWWIKHVTATGTIHLTASDWMYLTINGEDWEFAPGMGRWYHNPFTTTSIIVPASAFLATNSGVLFNVAGYGIEHVPEPLSLMLLAGGAGAIAVGRLRRRA